MNLLQSLAGDLDFVVGRLLRFLDEGVQHDDASADEKTIKCAADARAAAGPQFEQAVAECAGIRQLQVGAVFHQQFNNARVVRENIDGPLFDFG